MQTIRACFRTLILLTAAALTSHASAQAYPEKPLTLVVGFAPGGAADVVGRVLAEEMSSKLGQRVVVLNKSGAGGNIATKTVTDSPADGYTLLFAAINLATNPALMSTGYDANNDLAMVSQVTAVPVVMLVPASSPLRTPADILEAAKKTPNSLRVGSGGNGTSSHLAPELFFRNAGATFLHVPYRGGAPANQALIAGEIDLMFDLMSGSLKSLIESGKVRAVAVMQDSRVNALPNVPSARELGLAPATYVRSWQGIAVRSGTPQPIIDKLHDAVVAAARSPAFAMRAEQLGSDVVTSPSAAAFQQHYRTELQRWTALIKAAGIKAE